ncbi:type II CAAX endopeptidase family protein [Leuconostocaceae bacterium ESL0723]|nr:type II CAAX endopeptidase family protein [Leuconostocaceae bacterium ESL0723]
MEKIKSWRIPTALFWIVVGTLMVAFLDIMPQRVSHYEPQYMWLAVLVDMLILAAFIYWLQKKTGTVFEKIKWDYVWAALFGLVALFLVYTAVGLLIPHAASNNQAGLDKELKSLSGLNVFLFHFLVAILGPAIEETFFRGWMMWAMSRWNKWLRLAIIVLIFTAGHHPAQLFDWLAYGAMGVIFTLVRMETGKVQYSFITHALWNII